MSRTRRRAEAGGVGSQCDARRLLDACRLALARPCGVARLYHEKVGLEILDESEEAITFRSGSTELAVTKSTTGTSDEQTQAGWHVEDLEAELRELRARGVEIQEYDLPGLRTVDGIADIGFARAAWIVDPHGNALGILQRK